MRASRPLAATAALLALGGAALTAAPALATGASPPVSGGATSTLDLVELALAGHTLSALNLSATTSTVAGTLSRVSLVPAEVGSTALGATTVTPAQGSRRVGGQSAAIPGLASVTSPMVTASATSTAAGPQASAGATSLGDVSVLGLPMSMSGSVLTTSSTTTDAVAGKTLRITNLSLPSIGSLLAALGLDVGALPTTTLTTLASTLHLASAALTSATAALASAAAAVSGAPTTLAGATALVGSDTAAVTSDTSTVASDTAAVTSDTSTVASDTAAVTSDTSALQAQLDAVPTATLLLAGLTAPPTVSQFLGLPSATQQLLEAAVPAISTDLASLNAAQATLTAEQTALATAQTALTAAQTALAAAQAVLTAAQQLLTAITNLGTAVTGLLATVPLASIGSIDVTTLADAGPHLAATVTGTVSGVKVLGQDVLATVTGSPTTNVSALLGSLSGQLGTALGGLTGALSQVLSHVPGLPTLSVPAPVIHLLTVSKGTTSSGEQRAAHAEVSVLSVTIPSMSIPAAVALPGLAPVAGSGAAGLLSTPSITAVVGDLTDRAEATLVPAASTPPTVVTPGQAAGTPASTPSAAAPTLPFTGLNSGLPLTAAALLVAGVALLRARRLRPVARLRTWRGR